MYIGSVFLCEFLTGHSTTDTQNLLDSLKPETARKPNPGFMIPERYLHTSPREHNLREPDTAYLYIIFHFDRHPCRPKESWTRTNRRKIKYSGGYSKKSTKA